MRQTWRYFRLRTRMSSNVPAPPSCSYCWRILCEAKGVAIWEELFRLNYFDGLGVMAISQMTHCLFREGYNTCRSGLFDMEHYRRHRGRQKNKADRLLKTGRDDIANDLAESLRLWDLSSMMDALLPRPKHERHFETILDMVRRASERAGKGRSKGGSYAAAASKPTASIPQYRSWIMCYSWAKL